mmetsp:Transcript_68051/g.215271  ORF Transcript_68051/g.215271 Transcript_68051/m.215271 type:complete len:209 (-) Transcript_68051:267-893(-)
MFSLLEKERGTSHPRSFFPNSNSLLPRYDTAEEAARSYDMAARQIRGASARTNFPLVDGEDEEAAACAAAAPEEPEAEADLVMPDDLEEDMGAGAGADAEVEGGDDTASEQTDVDAAVPETPAPLDSPSSVLPPAPAGSEAGEGPADDDVGLHKGEDAEVVLSAEEKEALGELFGGGLRGEGDDLIFSPSDLPVAIAGEGVDAQTLFV